MKGFHSIAVVFLSGLVGANAGTIRICVQAKEGGTASALQGAAVKCYDEDWDADDDMTSTYYTGSDGCATLSYTSKSPKWYNPCTAWDCPGYTNPDIYCKVTKSNYYPVRATQKL